MSLQDKTIIGIDPGTNIMGYGIIRCTGRQIKLLELGVVHLSKYKTHAEKLKNIFLSIDRLLKGFKPDEMAIEAPFFGKNVQSMLKLGRAQGVVMAASMVNNVPVTEYSPKKIKVAVTGNGNAAKEQVYAMVERILNVKIESKFLDATDGLSAAICHNYQLGSAVKGEKKYKDWSAFAKEQSKRVK